MKISAGELGSALAHIGADDKARAIMIEALKKIDASIALPGVEVREYVTGPVLDAMFAGEKEVTKTLADGAVFTAKYTSKIIRDFVMAEEHPDHVWEPQTTKAAVYFAKKAAVAVVGGAYIGDHAVLMAREMKGRGAVHCFEPSSNADMLARNAAANGVDNIVVNRDGLWSGDKVELVLVGDDSHAYPQEAPAGTKGAFSAVSIDGYGARKGLDHIDFVMLDIEGGEMAALTGCERYLSQPAGKAPAVLFEVHRSYLDWSNGLMNTPLLQLLAKHGYELFALRDYNSNVPMAGHKVELIDAESVYLEGPPHGFNMLAVKSRRELDPNVFSFVSGVSPKLLKHRDPKLHAPLG